MKQSVRLGLFALLLGTLFLAPFCTIRSYAQSAPLTSPNVSSSITVTFKHGADETTKAHIRKAIRNLASKGVVPDGTHFYLNNAILSSSTSTTGQVGGSANNGGNQSGAQIGASVAQGGTQTGAGIIPSYLLAGKGYSLLLGLNTASTKSIGQDASSSTNNATSASALGATLLNPGTNTQSFNFIFLFEIGSRFKPQPPTGLTATINGNKVT
ncbi:MAG: hypothetical protein NT023_02825, partial [Armatimonadetes bacterium]|nr:hypothetical protein [Armatimonadota bacterium]